MKPPDHAKREQIIRAAIRQFLLKGFDGASVQEITLSADVAKGTMYTHFRSKDELVKEVFRYCHARDVEACDSGLDQEKTTTDKLLKRMENGIRWAIEHPGEAAIERMYLNSAATITGSGVQYVDQAHFTSVDPLIRKGIDEGVLKPLPPTLLGEVFFGASASFYYYFSRDPARFDDLALRAQCRQTVLDAISVSPRL